MGIVNEKIVMDFYVEQMKLDNIMFLKGRDLYKEKIEKEIIALENAENMNESIQYAKNLWKLLFESAMSYIDSDKRGYDKLFSYFDEYVDFEELIFASDSFYRDHTLHCLWVYFLGEYLKRHEDFKAYFGDSSDFGETLFANIKRIFEKSQHADIINKSIVEMGKIIKILNSHDSIRCITALSHDLGYPIKKISKINKCVQRVLPYFSIRDYDEFNFNYSDIQQNFIRDFLEIMSTEISTSVLSGHSDPTETQIFKRVFKMDFEIAKDNRLDIEKWFKVDDKEIGKLNEEELNVLRSMCAVKVDTYNDISEHARFSNDLEQYEHGIMSAFLLMKTLGAFNTKTIVYKNNSEFDYDSVDYCKIFAVTKILKAISDHTSQNFKIEGFSDFSEFLILVDEMEEFSRTSRANQNRQYVYEFCKTDLYMKDDWFCVDFIFDNDDVDGIDPEKAFKGRCKRFLNLFDISNLDSNIKIRLKCIGMLSNNKNTYCLEVANKYVNITVNEEEKNIPEYLKSRTFYTKEEYMNL